jgi:endonuclease-3
VTKQERADYAVRRLEELYPETPIPLDHSDAYTLLIAVLLSAQCTDIRVNHYSSMWAFSEEVEGDLSAFSDANGSTRGSSA